MSSKSYKNKLNVLVNQVKKFINEIWDKNFEVHTAEINAMINQLLCDFFDIITNITSKNNWNYKEYDIVSILPKYRKSSSVKDKIFNDIYRDITLKNKKHELFIREDYYYSQQLKILVLIICIKQFFEIYFNEKVAVDLSIAIVWDLSDKKYRKDIMNIWKLISPPERISKTVVIDTPKFVETIGKIYPKYYSQQVFKNYLPINSKVPNDQAIYFPFTIIETSLRYFTSKEIEILSKVVDQKYGPMTELSKKTGISRIQLSRTIRKFESLYCLRKRVFFSPQKIGFTSYRLIIIIKNKEIVKNFYDYFDYKLIKTINHFSGVVETIHINFYIPSSGYANSRFLKWKDDILVKKVHPKIKTIPVLFKPILGKELDEYTTYIVQPNLYDAENKEWILGDENNDFSKIKEKGKSINLDLETRKVISTLIEGPYRREEIYSKLKMNRNKLKSILDNLENNEIIFQKYIIPFFDDMITTMVLYDGNKWNDFIDKISSTLPLSVNYKLENVLDNSHMKTKFYGLSFLNIPNKFIKIIYKKIKSIDNSAQIALFPDNVEGTANIARTGKSGWKFYKLPKIKFIVTKEDIDRSDLNN